MTADTSQIRLALKREDAAKAIGVSDESFDRYVRPSLPAVSLGSLRVYPVDLLQQWLRERASTPEDQLEQARNSHSKSTDRSHSK